jgi:hypothetical protein
MIKFNEENHTYHMDDQELISVTTVLSKYFPFEEDKWAEITAKKTGYDVKYIKDSWDRWRTQACSKGTLYHNIAEDLYHGGVAEIDPIVSQIVSFYKDYSSMKKYGCELIIGSLLEGIAGTVDLILEDDDGLHIFDWKTSRKVSKFSVGKGLKPLGHLMDCSYTKYCLQLSMYAYLLENYYGKKIASLKVIHLDGKDDYKLIECKYLKKEVMEILRDLLPKD